MSRYMKSKKTSRQNSEGKRNVGFIIGGVPFTLAKQHRKGEERYTVLKTPSSYKAEIKKWHLG